MPYDRRLAFFLAIVGVMIPVAAQAYVGPGAGLTAIGTMLALLAALVLAVVGFVWYPLKRLLAKRNPGDRQTPEPTTRKAGGE